MTAALEAPARLAPFQCQRCGARYASTDPEPLRGFPTTRAPFCCDRCDGPVERTHP